MAEPESAVLPITPYPIGALKPLVRVLHRRYCQLPRADVQTTKNPASMLTRCPQPLKAPVAPKQLQRFEQRWADRRPGGRHPDRAEGLARFEAEILQQRA